MLLAALIALRVPSLVQPAGGDQGLYLYSGDRLLAGDIPYRDIWDQKPPGIAFLYASLLSIWHHESVVPAADLVAAGVTGWLLVVLGRRRFSEGIGFSAASIFLLFGDPSLQRLSGVYVRGQCEPFIALFVTAALVQLAAPSRRRRHLLLGGVFLAISVWLKYNAAAYGLTVVIAAWAWRADSDDWRRDLMTGLGWIGAGFGLITACVLAYFAAHGALRDLWLATIAYNLEYSNETYSGPWSLVRYLMTLPIARARTSMLWFVGGLGALALASKGDRQRSDYVVFSWLFAAACSIAINGQRDSPQYFVQAAPALALVAATGLASLGGRAAWVRYAAAAMLVAGVWRVGDEGPRGTVRWAGLPGLWENVRFDSAYAAGAIDRPTYLARFRGQWKFDALEIDNLARFLRETTGPDEPVYVFGFLGGSVCFKSGRPSSSRFFWSRPVVIEFAGERSDYGSAGVLADLQRRPPSVVALQREQWESEAFFVGEPRLKGWLDAGYVLDHETPVFSVWRRRNATGR